jgi:hypothetical protein
MQQLTTTATFTDRQLDDDSLTTIVARSVLEAALAAEDDTAELWFEIGRDDDAETTRLAIDLSPTDLEEILGLSGEADVAFSLDGDDVAALFDSPDVEAHGLRGAIAVAVTSAAILAPAGEAAVTQSIGTASTVQRANIAATTRVGAAATTQVSRVAAKTQVASVQAKLARSQAAAKVSGLRLLRSGLAR